ncbi:MAG: hypothetical protein ABIJ04_12150 [Bacteroidota bacterium]
MLSLLQKSGEITTVLYQCVSLAKSVVVFAFWNDYSTGVILTYTGYSFYNLEMEEAQELFNALESLMDQENKILTNYIGNIVYKFDELTFLFFNSGDILVNKPIRIWYDLFDSDWNQGNLKTTIKRFRKFFKLAE